MRQHEFLRIPFARVLQGLRFQNEWETYTKASFCAFASFVDAHIL